MKKGLIILLSIPFFGIAQTRFDSGEDLSYIMGTKKVSYEIRWDSATFNGNETEKAFCDSKVKEKNFAKPGDGDLWLEKWNESKVKVFPKYFLKFYEPRMKKSKLSVKENDPKAPFHMIIYILDIDPGNATIISINSRDRVNNAAKANFRTLIVDNANKSVIKSNIYSHKVQGMEGMSPYDMDKTDTGRIKNCFFMYGYILADQLVIFNKKNKK